jgi:hypothetical protein
VTSRTLILPAKRLPCGPLSEMTVSHSQLRSQPGLASGRYPLRDNFRVPDDSTGEGPRFLSAKFALNS